MRKPVIAGNWKMHTTREQAVSLAAALHQSFGDAEKVEVGVAPPFPYLAAVAEALKGSRIWVAAQDLHWEDNGAFTGDVSGAMLRDVGCTHAIVGHSERRQGWHESPDLIGKKVTAALRHDLVPIVCCGETLEERQADRTNDVVRTQLEAAFAGRSEGELNGTIIAYEPVWAIGTGMTATAAQAKEVHRMIRAWLAQRFSQDFADSLRIQYGGSVKPENAVELLAVKDVDGALVGGASLKADSFSAILQASETV